MHKILIAIFLFYYVNGFEETNDNIYCIDPDTGLHYPVNSTWVSTTFDGNYTCDVKLVAIAGEFKKVPKLERHFNPNDEDSSEISIEEENDFDEENTPNKQRNAYDRSVDITTEQPQKTTEANTEIKDDISKENNPMKEMEASESQNCELRNDNFDDFSKFYKTLVDLEISIEQQENEIKKKRDTLLEKFQSKTNTPERTKRDRSENEINRCPESNCEMTKAIYQDYNKYLANYYSYYYPELANEYCQYYSQPADMEASPSNIKNTHKLEDKHLDVFKLYAQYLDYWNAWEKLYQSSSSPQNTNQKSGTKKAGILTSETQSAPTYCEYPYNEQFTSASEHSPTYHHHHHHEDGSDKSSSWIEEQPNLYYYNWNNNQTHNEYKFTNPNNITEPPYYYWDSAKGEYTAEKPENFDSYVEYYNDYLSKNPDAAIVAYNGDNEYVKEYYKNYHKNLKANEQKTSHEEKHEHDVEEEKHRSVPRVLQKDEFSVKPISIDELHQNNKVNRHPMTTKDSDDFQEKINLKLAQLGIQPLKPPKTMPSFTKNKMPDFGTLVKRYASNDNMEGRRTKRSPGAFALPRSCPLPSRRGCKTCPKCRP